MQICGCCDKAGAAIVTRRTVVPVLRDRRTTDLQQIRQFVPGVCSGVCQARHIETSLRLSRYKGLPPARPPAMWMLLIRSPGCRGGFPGGGTNSDSGIATWLQVFGVYLR